MVSKVQVNSGQSIALPDNWKIPLIGFVLVLLTMTLVFWHTVAGMVGIWWRSDTFAHGFIIFPISGYLVWKKRNVFLQLTPDPQLYATILLCMLSAGWLLAYITSVQFLQQLMVVAMLPAIVWVIWGTAVARIILFPALYLFFAVPFGEFLIPYLQDITALMTVEGLRWTGIPVYMEGRFFSIPSGTFEVAKACSGLRYLIASVALGVLYAYITYRLMYKRVIFVLMSLLVPILANSLRAYGIVMIAHLSDYKLAVGVDHIIYGWVFFGVIIFLLFWIGSYFRDDMESGSSVTNENSAGESTTEKSAEAGSDSYAGQQAADRNTKYWYGTFAAVILAVASGPIIASWLQRPFEQLLQEPELPKLSGNWEGPFPTDDTWKPLFVNPTSERLVEYRSKSTSISVYVAYYMEQRQGAELINSENKLFDDQQWRRITETDTTVKLNNADKFNVHEVELKSRRGKFLLWHWNQIGGMSTINPLQAKLQNAMLKLTRTNVVSAAVIIKAPFQFDKTEARDALSELVQTMYPGWIDNFNLADNNRNNLGDPIEKNSNDQK